MSHMSWFLDGYPLGSIELTHSSVLPIVASCGVRSPRTRVTNLKTPSSTTITEFPRLKSLRSSASPTGGYRTRNRTPRE